VKRVIGAEIAVFKRHVWGLEVRSVELEKCSGKEVKIHQPNGGRSGSCRRESSFQPLVVKTRRRHLLATDINLILCCN
jgi:hypothetical protein